MAVDRTLKEWRADFLEHAGKSNALPIAGAIFWVIIALLGLSLPASTMGIIVALGSGLIFPLGLLIAKLRGADLLADPNGNPFNQLMLRATLMVNLLWPVWIIAYFIEPGLLVLGAAIGLGLHWIVWGWIANDRIGLVHTLIRTGLAAACYIAFQPDPVTPIALAVVASYGVTLALRGR